MDTAIREMIETRFSYHAPKDGQPEKYEKLRAKTKEFAYLITELYPKTRKQNLALTKLQESVMWANASIACHE